jgi:16S rRNA (uracil1498-N3)-methyltransferase
VITHLTTPDSLDGGEVEISGDAYRHLFRARRLAAGERLRLADGRGRARWGEIAAVDRRLARVVLGEAAPANEPRRQVELLVAALRSERASWLVEKATEIGVTAVRFLASRRTPRQYGDGRLERLRRVAAAAVEQCHRARLPEVTGVHPWEDVGTLLAGLDGASFLDFAANPGAADGRFPASDRQGVLIGPEGGWSAEERHFLAAEGVRAVALGERVLRVETAAVAAASLLLLGAAT